MLQRIILDIIMWWNHYILEEEVYIAMISIVQW